MDVVARDEDPARDLPFHTDRAHLALGIDELARIVRQLREVQAKSREDRRVIAGTARTDRDVARRKRRRGRTRIEHDRCAGQACGESSLPRRRRVRSDTERTVQVEAGLRVGAQLRPVDAVPAANRRPGIAIHVPGKTYARRKVFLCVAECLTVVAEPEIQCQIASCAVRILGVAGV